MSALLPLRHTDWSMTLLEARELRLTVTMHGRPAGSTGPCAESAFCTMQTADLQHLNACQCEAQQHCPAGLHSIEWSLVYTACQPSQAMLGDVPSCCLYQDMSISATN